jgi:ferredoxin
MLEILTRITDGKGEEGDIELLEELALNIQSSSLCGLGQTASNPVLSTLKYFRDEYEAHINDETCPVGECKALAKYRILEDKCKKCGLCARNCPVGAISGDRENGYKIDSATVPLRQWITYCFSEGCVPYFGVMTKESEKMVCELLMINEMLGYAHVMKMEFNPQILANREGKIKARLNSYIPIWNLKSLMDDKN